MSESISRHLRLIGFIILLIIFAILPLAFPSPYTLSILVMVGVYTVLAMTFILILRTGMVTLAIAGFWGIGAYASAVLTREFHLSFWLSLPAATALTALVALALGLVLIRNPGFSFTIITMIIGMLFVKIVGSTEWLGGYSGFKNIPPPNPIHLPFLPAVTFDTVLPNYYLMMFLLLIVVGVLTIMYRRWTGRAWTVIGLNSQLAESLGINVFRYRLIAFVVACAICGMFGSFYAHFLGGLKPDNFDIFKTVYVQIYAILGGIGFAFTGPLIGSLILVFFSEFMKFSQVYEPIISGSLIILLVIFLPSGILSLPGLRTLVGDPHKSVIGITQMLRNAFFSKREQREADAKGNTQN